MILGDVWEELEHEAAAARGEKAADEPNHCRDGAEFPPHAREEREDGASAADGVWHYIGPPGTGKTTALARQCRLAVDRFGHDQVVVASLTRAAAAEIGGRDLGVPPTNVGTLHALCYRALDRPKLAQGREGLREWNESHPPHFRLSGAAGVSDLDESGPGGGPTADACPGDQVLARLDVLRHQRVPADSWPTSVAVFASAWSAWKREAERADFTDLLETALAEVPHAVGCPRVLLLDEAQDFSLIERELSDRWSASARTTIHAGDFLQAIFSWRGADPRVLSPDRVAPGREKVLGQSYRVPRRVRDFAMEWVGQLRPPSYQYAPRDADGEVLCRPAWNWKQPERWVEQVEAWAAEGDVMILGACSFLLNPLIQVLRKRATPFGNRFRRRRGDWNPLARHRGRDATSTTDRLLAFLRPQREIWGSEARRWTREDLRAWIPMLRSEGTLARGAKARVADGRFPPYWSEADFFGLFSDLGSARRCLNGDLGWLLDHAGSHYKGTDAKPGPLDFPLRVLGKHGVRALREEPRIVVGTIHSTKGAEARRVVVLPDLSPSFARAWHRPATEEARELRRLFYVAATRARETLVAAGSGGGFAVGEWLHAARKHAGQKEEKT